VRATTTNKGKSRHLNVYFDGLRTSDVHRGEVTWYDPRGPFRAINWVLTGSEKRGYWTSYAPPVAWMSSILDVIGDRKLKHVCMPGSHDAGMWKIDGKTFGMPSLPVTIIRIVAHPNSVQG